MKKGYSLISVGFIILIISAASSPNAIIPFWVKFIVGLLLIVVGIKLNIDEKNK